MEEEKINKIILESTSQLSVPETVNKNEAWTALQNKIERQSRGKIVRLNPIISLSVAASITVFIGSYFLFFDSEKYSTGRGQHMTVILPDQSTITLNAESRVEYQPRNWEQERLVKFDGEGFFVVKKGGSFVVKTVSGTVEVVGTSFNILQRGVDFEISCFSGSVSVTSGPINIKLLAGETTKLDRNGSLTPLPVDTKTVSWKEGEFYFDNAKLQSVTRELERQFDIEIRLNSEQSLRTYSGYFNTIDLDEALKLVFEPMKLSYQKDGKKIIVK